MVFPSCPLLRQNLVSSMAHGTSSHRVGKRQGEKKSNQTKNASEVENFWGRVRHSLSPWVNFPGSGFMPICNFCNTARVIKAHPFPCFASVHFSRSPCSHSPSCSSLSIAGQSISFLLFSFPHPYIPTSPVLG